QVGARAECGWGAGDHNGGHVVASLQCLEGRHDPFHHFRRQRIATARVVEGEDSDAVGFLGADHSGVRTTADERLKKFSTSRSYLYSGLLCPTVFRSRLARAKLSTAPADV